MIRAPFALGVLAAATLWVALPTAAQIQLGPPTIQPAAWERFTLGVINQSDSAIVRVRLVVPEVLMVLGVESIEGWAPELTAATDTSPQFIEWSGAELRRGGYREFAFLGRLPADAKRRSLVFPVTVLRADGGTVAWDQRRDTPPPPAVRIVGSTNVTAWGSMGLAGAAMGVAVIALALAISWRAKRPEEPANA